MDSTPILALPYILSGQAKKHVTHNESLRILDAVCQLTVSGINQSTPPLNAAEGSVYALSETPVEAWSGQAGRLAAYIDSAWVYIEPKEGWRAVNVIDGNAYQYSVGAWVQESIVLGQLGLNATSSEITRLAVASQQSLFSHDGADHRLSLNKASDSDTASLVFLDDYSARAEIGLNGSDAFSLKTTNDGIDWLTSLVTMPGTGMVRFPRGLEAPLGAQNLLLNPHFAINQRGWAGPSLMAGTYGVDRWKAGASGAVFTVTDGAANLTHGSLVQIVEVGFVGPQTFTISFHLEAGQCDLTVGNQTQLLMANGGRQIVVFEDVQFSNGILLCEIEGVCSVSDIQLYLGQIAGGGQRPIAQELLLCQRYFATSFLPDVPVGSVGTDDYQQFSMAWHSDITTGARLSLPVHMRVTPSISFFSSIGGADDTWYVVKDAQFISCSVRTNRPGQGSFSPEIYQAGLGLVIGQSYFIGGHWAADAEL